ncbi:MAG: PEP-CTERM sorting domain-containing protein [Pseudomonadota bacterium]
MIKALVSGIAAAAVTATSAFASVIVIQYTGVNVEYDGSTISNTGADGSFNGGFPGDTTGADPLSTVSFFVGNNAVDAVSSGAILTLSSDIFLELELDGITNIPVGGGTVSTADTGAGLDLLLQSGATGALFNFNGDAEVTYVPTATSIDIVFAGGTLLLADQNLPIFGMIDETSEIIFSLSLQTNNATDDGAFLTSFDAQGTGEIQGTFISEPSMIALFGLGLIGLGFAARRRA